MRLFQQGHALSCLLFNLALKKVVRDSDPTITGSSQVLVYADDVNLIDRTVNDCIQTFRNLNRCSMKKGFTINGKKARYVMASRVTQL